MIPTEQTQRKFYLSAVLELWRKGFDTYQIAKTIRDKESSVERGLHEALELERKGKPPPHWKG